MKQEYSVIIERDSDGFYVASVPELQGVHTQARSMDELLQRVREAIALALEDELDFFPSEFVGIQRVSL